jgi:hypothetical protein
VVLEYRFNTGNNSSGNESLAYTVYTAYHADISPIFGNGIGECIFESNTTYRIIITSDSSISDSDWVGVDYIIMKPVNEYNITSYGIFGGTVPVTEQRVVDSINIAGTGTQTASAHYTFPVFPFSYCHVFMGLAAVGAFTVTYAFDADMTGMTVYVSIVSGTWTGSVYVDLDISIFNGLISL